MTQAREELSKINDRLYEDDGFFDPDGKPFTKDEKALAHDLFELFQELVNKDSQLTEKFHNKDKLLNRYKTHSLANVPGRVSVYDRVYYDFTDKNKYGNYEYSQQAKMQTTKNVIPTLNNTELVVKNMRTLFEGERYVLFTTSCGFEYNNGHTMLGLHSFSSDVTTNYKRENTIDVIVFDACFTTLTMYPVDAHYLETRFNEIAAAHTNLVKTFKFNH